MYRDHSICRACDNTNLIPVADFGIQPLANDFIRPGLWKAGHYPLKVLFCENCTLAQLSVVVAPETLYSNYSYVTSPSRTMLDHFKALAHYAGDFRNANDLGDVLEIGSNNGAFLKWLVDFNFTDTVQGVDPAINLATIAQQNGVPTRLGMWNGITAATIGVFDTVFARHVFAHVDDWRGFIAALEIATHKDSTVFIEVPSARDTIDRGEFDQCYSEHLSYITTQSIHALLKGTRFYLHDSKRFPIHGGSIVYVLKRRGPTQYQILYRGGETPVTAEDWKLLRSSAENQSSALEYRLGTCLEEGKSVFGFGATAKATLWAQLTGLSSYSIKFIHDDTPQKQGTTLPGTDIPVIDGTERMKDMDVCVIFAWNFEAEIREKLAWWSSAGGTFLVPNRLNEA